MARRREEDGIQRACAEYLFRLHPTLLWWHTPNGGARSKVEGAIFKAMGVRPGVPDLTIVRDDGRILFIEVKTATGRLSPAQKEWRRRCDDLDIPYRVLREVSDLPGILREFGIG